MTSSNPDPVPRRISRGLRWLLLLPVALLAVHLGRPGARDTQEPLFTVRRGPLIISVTERGSIENREKEIVKSGVAGRTAIVSLIDEGAVVKKGDLLVELNASSFEEERIEQEIRTQNSEAALIQAQESLAITRNQAEADMEEAELRFRFAELDLTKYREGDYPMSLQKADSQITLAGEELRNAEDRHAWSTNLAAQGYITQAELLSDELALKRKRIDLETAIKDRGVLVQYRHDRDLQELESAVRQTRMAMERTRRKTRADMVKAEADLRARESEHERQKSRLAKTLSQIEACRIVAPADGMVVYATSGQGRGYRGGEPLKIGTEVTERQELIHLPTSRDMNVSIRVQESSLRKISVGQRVRVTVDAVPGRIYRGVLTHIPVLPDATRAWLNPDLKIYACEAQLEGGAQDLRPGMSCRAEIVVEELADVVFVPVQCILRVNHLPTAHVYAGGSVEKRTVVMGMDNGRMLHVIEGLLPGEQVLLNPPLADAALVSGSFGEEREMPSEPGRETDAGPAEPAVDSASEKPGRRAPHDGGNQRPASDRSGKEPRGREAPSDP